MKLRTSHRSLRMSLYSLKEIKACTTFGFRLLPPLDSIALFAHSCNQPEPCASSADGRDCGLVTRRDEMNCFACDETFSQMSCGSNRNYLEKDKMAGS